MNAAELLEELNRATQGERITPKRLATWIKQGLPCKGRGRSAQFDPDKVATWLTSQGIAKQKQVTKTLGEVAKHFDVAERTAAYWRSRGMPGEPGNFDLDEIADWRRREGLARSAEGQEQDELTRIEVELKQLKLDKERGELVKVEPVIRLVKRHIHAAKVHLEQLPDEILADLADIVPRERLDATRKLIQRRIDSTSQAIAETLRAEELSGKSEDLAQVEEC